MAHLAEIKRLLSSDESLYTEFLNHFQTEHKVKGDILLKEGEPQNFAFIIKEGEIRRYKTIQREEQTSIEVEIEKLTIGRVVGFHHLISEEISFASLQVISEEAEIMKISSNSFRVFLMTKPKFALSWVQLLAQTVRKQSKVIRGLQGEVNEDDSRLRIAFFDSSNWTKIAFNKPEYKALYNMTFFDERLDTLSVNLAANFKVISCFVNDNLSGEILRRLSQLGVEMISMRCAGFDRVDRDVAYANDMTVTRVPEYSPYAVAEHAIALLLTLNRKLHKAYNCTRDGNFSLDGLIGFDLHGKTAGVIGTGRIGCCVVQILLGFGCQVLCYDLYKNETLLHTPNVKYVELDELYAESKMIFLHAPLNNGTKHMINKSSIDKMKDGVVIINTSRGGLIDSMDLLSGLKSKKISAVGLDVYENESPYFFSDHSHDLIEDEVLRDLLSMNNVLITSHQAFLTDEAINNIAKTSIENIALWSKGATIKKHPNSVY